VVNCIALVAFLLISSLNCCQQRN